MNKPITLERRTAGKLEIVSLYDDIYTHYTEEEGKTSTCSQTYERIGLTKQQCLVAYQEEGFGEVDNASIH
jgi:hypothetical protein